MLPIRTALRSLGRSPSFTITAVLSLALAIGASAAARSAWCPRCAGALPFPEPDRLVLITEEPVATEGQTTSRCPSSCDVRYDTFAQLLHDHAFQSVDAVAAFSSGGKALATGGEPLLLNGGVVSPKVFEMLHAGATLGRPLTADDDRLGAPLVTVLSYGLWQTHFAGDRGIIGRDVKLSDSHYTVVGVMPPGFSFEVRSDFWLPAVPTLDPSTRPSIRSVNVLARLAPGKSPRQLQEELAALTPALRALAPRDAEMKLTVLPLRDRYVAATQSHDLIFAAVVGCVLLIACANLASLLLVRTLRQQDELALRSAVGASSRKLIEHLLAQNTLLVLAGAMGGLAVATMSLGVLRSHPALASFRPEGMDYRIDLWVVLFLVGVSAAAGVLLSVIPARLISQVNAQALLRSGALSLSRSGSVSQRALVVMEVGLAVVLLVGAGLLARTEWHYANVDLGFDVAHLVSTVPSYPHPWRVKETYVPVTERIAQELSTVPGAASVAVQATVSLLTQGTVRITRSGDAEPLAQSDVPKSVVSVSPGYFSTVAVRVKSGREFTTQDDEHGLPVAVVNDWAAKRWWPSGDAIGQIVRVDTGGAEIPVTIVGVVANSKASATNLLLGEDGPELYRPYRQVPSAFPQFLVRAVGNPASLLIPVRQITIRQVPDRPSFTGLLRDQVEQQLGGMRDNAQQILGFAVAGVLLAVLGIYGLLAYAVSQRTRELGIRGALGASRQSLAGMVVADGMRLALIGVLLG
ncbi:MAG: ABC transporter permease, partial [Gemmatimonadaceae bacterium]